MTVHAFVDESRRGSLYIVAAVIAKPVDLRQLRRELRGRLLPGQRELHFSHENERRRRELADLVARLSIEVRVYHKSCEKDEELARQRCIQRLTSDLLDRGAHRLAIDSRSHRDPKDEATIAAVIGRRSHPCHLAYEHIGSTSEPLLWAADVVAWCFNRGGSWRTRVGEVVAEVVDLDGP